MHRTKQANATLLVPREAQYLTLLRLEQQQCHRFRCRCWLCAASNGEGQRAPQSAYISVVVDSPGVLWRVDWGGGARSVAK